MSYLMRSPVVRPLLVASLLLLAGISPATFGQSNVLVRVMAANTTSGSLQRYETPGLNIFKGLKPDIVAIQEFNVSNAFGINTAPAVSNMVATTFGPDFSYFRESAGYTIPNGIISRWPIVASGSWVDSDSGVNDRGFAWARIDLPATNDLYVVSVHLKASSGSSNEDRRHAQASELKALISTNFPAGAWVIVAGDFNLYSESEPAIITLKTFLSDTPVPADQNGNTNTNAGRAERYDRVLPSFSLTNLLTPLVMPTRTYAGGLVFDSRVYTPLSEVAPVVSTDSGVSGMQHMAVVKAFQYTITTATPPVISNQPPSLVVTQGNPAAFTVVAGGSVPLSYQWRFFGTNLPAATNATFTRPNAQPADEGNYLAVITNSAGSVTSAVATLTVRVPPAITAQPLGAVTNQGAPVLLSVAANGTTPLHYAWRLNGTNLPGATSATYSIAGLQPATVGNYSVLVSNAAGALLSSNAALGLIIPEPILTATAPTFLTWAGLSNLAYTVQARTNLRSAPWTPIGTAISPNQQLLFLITNTTLPELYFRVVYP